MRCRQCDYRLWNIAGRACPECGTPFKPSDYEFVANSVRFCCPHCAQEYYGTGEKGHLVPREFDCVSCGRRIDMDQMLLRPAEEVPEEHTAVEYNPWTQRARLGRFKAWYQTCVKAMIAPDALIRNTPADSPLKDAVTFALLTQGAVVIFGPMVFMLLPIGMMVFLGGVGVMSLMALILIPLVFMLTMLSLLFWAACTHAALRMMGAAEPFPRTLLVICYSGGANALAAIPCVNFITSQVSSIWWLISAILMLRESHRVSGGRAALAVLAAPVFIAIVALSMFLSFGAWAARTMPTLANTMPGFVLPSVSWTTALINDADPVTGAGPAHVITLIDSGAVPLTDLFAPASVTTAADVPVGRGSLEDFFGQSADVRATLMSQMAFVGASSAAAYRFGDLVFTYPGIDLRAPPADLWLWVMSPDPEVNGEVDDDGMIVLGAGDGSVMQCQSRHFDAYLAAQNLIRERHNLPALPDLRTMRQGDSEAQTP